MENKYWYNENFYFIFLADTFLAEYLGNNVLKLEQKSLKLIFRRLVCHRDCGPWQPYSFFKYYVKYQ